MNSLKREELTHTEQVLLLNEQKRNAKKKI